MASSTVKVKTKQCAECFGKGWNYSRFSTANSEVCTMCWGSGSISDYSEITFNVFSLLEASQPELIDELRAKIAALEARIADLEAEKMESEQ